MEKVVSAVRLVQSYVNGVRASELKRIESEKLRICKSCGARCCKAFAPTLTVFDVDRLHRYLKVEPDRFVHEYCDITTFEELVKIDESAHRVFMKVVNHMNRRSSYLSDMLRSTPVIRLKKRGNECIFLEGNTCRVHRVKPLICRVFPLRPFRALDGLLQVSAECLLSRRSDLLYDELRHLVAYLTEVTTHVVLTLGLSTDDLIRLVRHLEFL